MSTATRLESQQSPGAARRADAPCGSWSLGDRQALALQPRVRSVLRVQAGGLWVTVTPRGGQGARAVGARWAADRFLQPGDALVVDAGERAVFEPWPAGGAAFAWEPLSCAAPAAVSVREAWRTLVAPPWAELAGRTRSAFGHAGAAGLALGRLALGLWRFAGARRRGRIAPPPCGAAH